MSIGITLIPVGIGSKSTGIALIQIDFASIPIDIVPFSIGIALIPVGIVSMSTGNGVIPMCIGSIPIDFGAMKTTDGP